jgi:hypothetical protein
MAGDDENCYGSTFRLLLPFLKPRVLVACQVSQETAAFSSRSRIIDFPPNTNFGRAHDR